MSNLKFTNFLPSPHGSHNALDQILVPGFNQVFNHSFDAFSEAYKICNYPKQGGINVIAKLATHEVHPNNTFALAGDPNLNNKKILVKLNI